jgi:hypothetical protein
MGVIAAGLTAAGTGGEKVEEEEEDYFDDDDFSFEAALSQLDVDSLLPNGPPYCSCAVVAAAGRKASIPLFEGEEEEREQALVRRRFSFEAALSQLDVDSLLPNGPPPAAPVPSTSQLSVVAAAGRKASIPLFEGEEEEREQALVRRRRRHRRTLSCRMVLPPRRPYPRLLNSQIP